MKTTKILGATTIAGALLFTGTYANTNETYAKSEVTLATPDEWQQRHDEMVKAKQENPNRGGEGGGPGAISSYQDSYQEYVEQNLKYDEQVDSTEIIVPQEGKDFLNNQEQATNNNQEQATNNNQEQAANNNQEQAANNNQEQATNSNQEQATNSNQEQGTNNNQEQATNNNQEQTQNTVLPKTGEESTNTTFTTIIASILLATGSLLTFKRFSKTNK